MNGNHMFTPNYVDATGLLKHLNSEELKELLNDDSKLDNVIKDLQQVKNVEAEKEILITSNKSIAEYNLSLKPTFEESRIAVTSLYSRASDLKHSVVDKKEKLENRKSQQSLSSVLAILQAKTAKVEEETEAYVEKMLSEELNVNEFLKLFLATRTKVHILHTKVDKMAVMIQNPDEPSLQSSRPARSKKAPPPPPRPLPPIQPLPFNPFITSNPFPQPSLIPQIPSNYIQNDNRYIVPTRTAPQPPPHLPNFPPQNMPPPLPGSFNPVGMYTRPSVPLMPQPYLKVNMPKKY